MKFLLVRRGWRKDFAQLPATVMEESWPSLAILFVSSVLRGFKTRFHTHVWSQKHPLWEHACRKLFLEHRKVLGFG